MFIWQSAEKRTCENIWLLAHLILGVGGGGGGGLADWLSLLEWRGQ